MITKKLTVTFLLTSIVMMSISGTTQMAYAQIFSSSQIGPDDSVLVINGVDASGSISTVDPDGVGPLLSEYDLEKGGMAAGYQAFYDANPGAFARGHTFIVDQFASVAMEECGGPITVDNQADLDTLKACLLALTKDVGSFTCVTCFFVLAKVQALANPSDVIIIDLVSDGFPEEAGKADAVALAEALAARDSAVTPMGPVERVVALGVAVPVPAGVDFLEDIVFPQPGVLVPPNPIPPIDGFAIIAPTFDDFAEAFKNKLAELTPPCEQIPQPDFCVGGEFLPIDSTALLIAGFQSGAIWMLPALAGAAGAGAYFIRTRMNRD